MYLECMASIAEAWADYNYREVWIAHRYWYLAYKWYYMEITRQYWKRPYIGEQ